MPGRVLMIQGTMSSVGKSLLVAALCRIFRQDGLRVAPFKAQNMALNSFVTHDGHEIGRAQAMQADAAGIDVTVEMNPILIKPETDSFAQIVVMGQPWMRLPARDYMHRRAELWSVVTRALDTLRTRYDLVVIEGAGSPVELNLRQSDIVNMAIARYAHAPVLLVGDIDRGGIFAQLLGTLMLLEEPERALVRGLIVNKFRGDPQLFETGVHMLEERGHVPVLGVVPFIHNLRIADEDSVALDDARPMPAVDTPATMAAQLDIAVIRLPHISNFDDFNPLAAEPAVNLRFVEHVADVGHPDLIILPGTKTTVADLHWLQTCGLAACLIARVQAGTPIIGICGGYQMLGQAIYDPDGVEASSPVTAGLGLLSVQTIFAGSKQTVRARGRIATSRGLFATAHNLDVEGYEIHMGRTTLAAGTTPLLHVTARGAQPIEDSDGALAADGLVAGTYLHGLFDNDALRQALLSHLATQRGKPFPIRTTPFDRTAMYDYLAATTRANLDRESLYRIIGIDHLGQGTDVKPIT